MCYVVLKQEKRKSIFVNHISLCQILKTRISCIERNNVPNITVYRVLRAFVRRWATHAWCVLRTSSVVQPWTLLTRTRTLRTTSTRLLTCRRIILSSSQSSSWRLRWVVLNSLHLVWWNTCKQKVVITGRSNVMSEWWKEEPSRTPSEDHPIEIV